MEFRLEDRRIASRSRDVLHSRIRMAEEKKKKKKRGTEPASDMSDYCLKRFSGNESCVRIVSSCATVFFFRLFHGFVDCIGLQFTFSNHRSRHPLRKDTVSRARWSRLNGRDRRRKEETVLYIAHGLCFTEVPSCRCKMVPSLPAFDVR